MSRSEGLDPVRRFSAAVAAALVLSVPLVASVTAAVPALAAPAEAGAAASARAEVGKTIDDIVKLVASMPGEARTAERRAKLREIINPRFDFEEMARRSLGPAWAGAEEGERREFVAVFSDLLARTYLNRIETVRPGMVKIDDKDGQVATGGDGTVKALVKTSVTNKGSTFPINYKLLSEEGRWKVYDVVIENIGLVQNYRNEFAGIIRKEKLSGLITKLKAKNSAAA